MKNEESVGMSKLDSNKSIMIKETYVFSPSVEGGNDVRISIIVERENGVLTRFHFDFHGRVLEWTNQKQLAVAGIRHHLNKPSKKAVCPSHTSRRPTTRPYAWVIFLGVQQDRVHESYVSPSLNRAVRTSHESWRPSTRTHESRVSHSVHSWPRNRALPLHAFFFIRTSKFRLEAQKR